MMLDEISGVETVLEIGVGVGAAGARLARRYDYTGIESDERSAAIARTRIAANGGTVVHGRTHDLESGASFDLVCAFEVLEHIEDDTAAMREWRRLVRPGGWLMISVPAWPQRFGAHDEIAGHFRRYERAQLEGLAASVGLVEARILAYGFPLGNLLEAAWHFVARRSDASGTLEERTAKSGRRFQPPGSLGWATQIVALPFALLQRPFVNSDLGTGLILVAQAPQTDVAVQAPAAGSAAA